METGGAVKSTPSEDGRLFAIPMIPYMAPRPKNMIARFPTEIDSIRFRDSEDERELLRRVHAGEEKYITLEHMREQLARTDDVWLLFEIIVIQTLKSKLLSRHILFSKTDY